jgi:hypothetical protein
MTSAPCSWCEKVSICADLIGFLGGLALAFPFLVGQPTRDRLDNLARLNIPKNEDALAIGKLRQALLRSVVKSIPVEYGLAWIGAIGIAAAFLLKFISAVF